MKQAETSPALRLAFSEGELWGFDEKGMKHVVALEIELSHGLKLHYLEKDKIERLDTYRVVKSAITAAEESLIYFDALVIACGRILDAGVQLHPQLQSWLVNYLLGRTTPPPPKRGPDPYPKLERNFLINHFLSHMEMLNYPITENEATFKDASACHAIHVALGAALDIPSVKRLMNIWSERRSQR
ncbi:hypothetical protein ACFSUD_10315 [Sulfitobacter aestuarii]|uniref:Uncharacterized protein n=1 Tax=Sulfitobacter aestuarii TaxID=2161676 RepID=A0ABW5U289_9RHOB